MLTNKQLPSNALTPELGMDVESFTIDRERQRIIYTCNKSRFMLVGGIISHP